jgi:hypothetical protein
MLPTLSAILCIISGQLIVSAIRSPIHAEYTWHCSAQGLPSCCIAAAERELLPHIFTLIPQWRDSYFLWHFLFLINQEPRLTRGGLPYAVRTFLPENKSGTIARVCSSVKLLSSSDKNSFRINRQIILINADAPDYFSNIKASAPAPSSFSASSIFLIKSSGPQM